MDYSEDNFIDNIKNFVLELVEPTDTNNKEVLDKFLNIIIPRTRVLFNSIKKYIHGKLSMETLISYLEPFHIYSNDITYMQYVEINKFIKSQIIEYNKKFVENGRKFSAIKNMQFHQPIKNNLFEILNKNMDIKQTAVEKYGGESNLIYNNSELLKKITLIDFGNLYNTSVAFENIALMFPNELNAVFDSDKDKLHKALLKDTENNKCKAFQSSFHLGLHISSTLFRRIFGGRPQTIHGYRFLQMQGMKVRIRLGLERDRSSQGIRFHGECWLGILLVWMDL
jgi:hypothetical protein